MPSKEIRKRHVASALLRPGKRNSAVQIRRAYSMQKNRIVTLSVTKNTSDQAERLSKVSRNRVRIFRIMAATRMISKVRLGMSLVLPICMISNIRFLNRSFFFIPVLYMEIRNCASKIKDPAVSFRRVWGRPGQDIRAPLSSKLHRTPSISRVPVTILPCPEPTLVSR